MNEYRNINNIHSFTLLCFFGLKSDRSSDHATNRWPTGPAAVNISLYKNVTVGAANCNAATAAITIIIGID
jgi:hypothetical protein